MKKELLIKYLNNSCTEKEYDEFVSWAKQKDKHIEGRSWSLECWENFAPEQKMEDAKKYNSLLDKIHHQINLNSETNKQKSDINLTRIVSLFSRVAAILFLPLLGLFLYMMSNTEIESNEVAFARVDTLEIIAPLGSRVVTQLSDGTEVNLNYGSRLKYPREFIGNTRDIELIGEAYFNVTHNPEKPFTVQAGALSVKVLGTEFNVQSYPDNEFISTTLVNGKVALEKIVLGEKNISLGTMIPGQHVSYNSISDEISSTQGNIAKYIAWKDGKLIFDNEPISEVAKKLSRMFNVDIEVDKNVMDFTYTATITDDPLYLILDLMEEITPVTYNVLPRKKLSDGRFTKQKIIIKGKTKEL